MLSIIDFTKTNPVSYRELLPRADFNVDEAVIKVAGICQAVKDEGAAALRRFAREFDHVQPDSLRVDPAVIAASLDTLDPDVRHAIQAAIDNRRRVCQMVEREEASRSVELNPGALITNRISPVNRVGLYAPGGVAPLASSVVMNVVPAQEAGVGSLAVASPPQQEFDGLPHPTILATCALLGVDEVYAVGGAQAIAMFAYGVDGLCPKADLVTGPGNIFVVAAKRFLRGEIGIDAEAGPTEIAILADDSADPSLIAADLISQAEHDVLAGSVLITPSRQLASRVNEEVSRQVDQLATRTRLAAALSGVQSGIVIVRDIVQGIDVANEYAAEHLEIHTADAHAVASRITNAGAIFIGPFSPVPLGDYCAGSTHVLPTHAAARYSSGLTVRSFMKSVHLIDYSAEALDAIGDDVTAFAYAENLPGHAQAIIERRRYARGER